MDISLVAIMSIVALLIVVIISCINEDLNVGFLAIGFAIIVAGVWGDTKGAAVLNYFPTSLFMILVGSPLCPTLKDSYTLLLRYLVCLNSRKVDSCIDN